MLFQILKDDAVKVLHSICQQIWKTQQWPQDWKRSVFIPSSKKGNARECSNYRTIALISHSSKAMLKILQARLQQYMNCEIPDVQAGFRKGRGTRDQIANTCWIIKKARIRLICNVVLVSHVQQSESVIHVHCCSIAQSCPTLCDPMNCSRPSLSAPHHLPKFA